MIEINLLKDLGDTSSGVAGQVPVDPVDAIKKICIIAIPIVISVGAGVMFNNLKNIAKIEVQTVLDNKKAELAQLDKIIKDIEGVTEETNKLDDKLQKMKEIFDLRILNVKALDSIKVNIPNQIFLSRISINTNNDTLKLSGIAESNETIKQFITKLNTDSAFEEGKVLLDMERKIENSIEFEVSAKILRIKYAQNQ